MHLGRGSGSIHSGARCARLADRMNRPGIADETSTEESRRQSSRAACYAGRNSRDPALQEPIVGDHSIHPVIYMDCT